MEQKGVPLWNSLRNAFIFFAAAFARLNAKD